MSTAFQQGVHFAGAHCTAADDQAFAVFDVQVYRVVLHDLFNLFYWSYWFDWLWKNPIYFAQFVMTRTN